MSNLNPNTFIPVQTSGILPCVLIRGLLVVVTFLPEQSSLFPNRTSDTTIHSIERVTLSILTIASSVLCETFCFDSEL